MGPDGTHIASDSDASHPRVKEVEGAPDTPCPSAHDDRGPSDSRLAPALSDVEWKTLLDDLAASGHSPLPLCHPPRPPRPSSKSPRILHRWLRAVRLWESLILCVDTINDLGGAPAPPISDCRHGRLCQSSCSCRKGQLAEAHRRTHLRLIRGCQHLQEGRRLRLEGTGDDWRSVLVHQTGDFYGFDASPDKYESFIANSIDEPPVGAPTVDALALSPLLGRLYGDPDKLLRKGVEGTDEFALVCKRFDRILGSRTEYRRYFARSEVHALWELAPAADTRCPFAMAAVKKEVGSVTKHINGMSI